MKASPFFVPLFLKTASLILLLCNFSSCKFEREPCPPEEYYVDIISDADKAYIPYTGYDTLTFLNTHTNDTHVFIGTGVIQYFSSTTFPLNMECPGGHAELETYGFEFVSSTSSNKLIVNAFISYHGDPGGFTIQFTPSIYETSLADIQGGTYSYDSLEIANKTYYKIKRIFIASFQGTSDKLILYNSQFGVLSIITKDGVKWELISKK